MGFLPVIAALQTALGTTQGWRCYRSLLQRKTATEGHALQKKSVENESKKNLADDTNKLQLSRFNVNYPTSNGKW